MAEKLKRRRGAVRAVISRSINEMNVLLNEPEVNMDAVNVKFNAATGTYEKLQVLDSQVLDEMMDGECSDAEYLAEEESVMKYNEDWQRIKYQLEKRQVRSRPGSPSPSDFSTAVSQVSTGGSSDKKKTYKLPKIEIRKFSGEVKEWLGFWAQFKKLHEDEQLHVSDKFQYLVQSTVNGSKARAMVERYPQSEENYPKAVKALQDRFGKPKVLIHYYIRELIHLIIRNSNSKVKLTEVYDELESQLQALESMGVPAEQMDRFLLPMVESCLPNEILTAWQRSSNYGIEGDADESKGQFQFLMEFVKQEVDSEHQRDMAQTSFAVSGKQSAGQKDSKKWKKAVSEKKESEPATASGLFSGQGSECVFCDKSHASQECRKAQDMSIQDKESRIKEKKACFACLKKGHGSKNCKSFTSCVLCKKKHHAVMCPELPAHKKQKNTSSDRKEGNNGTVATNLNCTEAVLLKTVLVRVLGENKTMVVRLLLDEGSQRSYIKEATAKKLKLKPYGQEVMKKSLFGGNTSEIRCHQKYELVLESLDARFRLKIPVLDEPKLCGTIPRIPKGPWMTELKERKIQVNDSDQGSPEIEVLIGSDNWGDIVKFNGMQLNCGLVAMETVFGWTLSGPLPREESFAMNVTSALFVQNSSVTDLWTLESLGIRDPIEVLTTREKEKLVIEHFSSTVKRKEDGRYSVSLPWTAGRQDIPSNREIAEKRLLNTTKKLQVAGKWNDYAKIFDSWEQEGIIREVKDIQGHFLPHRAVFKPESLTTPIRPVFDASCKSGRNPSLNECLEKGPNLLELIPSVLLRFREKKIGVTSDIRKAFQMIEVDKEDRRFQKFLWWEDEECKKYKIFEHQRVVFGLNCSPYLLQAVLSHHLRMYKGEDASISEKFLRSLYVDNCVTSVDSTEDYENFKKRSTEVLAEAKMELRQWERTGDTPGIGQSIGDWCGLGVASQTGDTTRIGQSSSEGRGLVVASKNPTTSVLGLRWDKQSDVLQLDFEVEQPKGKLTKREVLSIMHKVFDPIGFSAPALLQPKLIIQKLWSTKIEWDDEIPSEISEKFQKWCYELTSLQKIAVPRQIINTKEPNKLQLHTFGDASQSAYAAVVFLRSVSNGKVSVQLAQAKSRVSPLKKGTIPRLELMASLIGSRLAKSTMEALNLKGVANFYWSDSTTALSWIRRNDVWGTFVGNRVREILTNTKAENWRFVPGELNPADLPSRGCSPTQLLVSKWWEGPTWLKQSPSEWPSHEDAPNEEEVAKERKKTTTTMLSTDALAERWFETKYSSYHSNVKTMGWVHRFVENSRKGTSERNSSLFLTILELRKAEVSLLHQIQKESFPCNLSHVSGIPTQRMEDGLLHMKSKLLYKDDSDLFRWPILLPKSHPLVDQLIREVHLVQGHVGTQCLLGMLRERFWILQGRQYVKRIIRQCVSCRRFEAKSLETDPAALPAKRVTLTHPFITTGVDLAGPLYLRNGKKAWVVLFTCAVYRGVYLDFVTSLSTEAFLGSLERFLNMHGRPNTIYSDNGTNFVGTVNLFKKLDWNRISAQCKVKQIQWLFNPPTAAWWGGWWEILVKNLKNQLKRMLGRAKLNEEDLRTCLTTVTAAINNRPLTTLTEDIEDLTPLTPAMFLRGQIVTEFPEKTELSSKELRQDYRRTATLRKQLESRFRKEYLSLLMQKIKGRKTEVPKVGDVVLVGADGKKRIDWPMGKILELVPGKDGVIRVVKVKTATGTYLRPLQRVYPLEIPNPSSMTEVRNIPKNQQEAEVKLSIDQETEAIEEISVVKTKSGRIIKKPSRYE